jgi:hypothetical protein
MVDHIHLDEKYIQHTLKKEQYAALYQLFFLIVTVCMCVCLYIYIYMQII